MNTSLSKCSAYWSSSLVKKYWSLTKPRVTQLAVFCAVIGMFLASPGMVDFQILFGGSLGIALLASAAFALNCLAERKIDATMERTLKRPSASFALNARQITIFSISLVTTGVFLLYYSSNLLTVCLTLLTFFGYTIIYTLILKPATSQNIVIGGLAGAMPPALGWAAVTNNVAPEAWILVLIIFTWTPPHFWTLALYRRDDYLKAGLPMLPITHGEKFTLLYIFLYTIIMIVASILPFIYGTSGGIYLICALLLGGGFLGYAALLYCRYSDALAKSAFRYSIFYLSSLFTTLLIDNYVNKF